ncbi:PCI domain-containing protein 2 [Chionoecetes opilio]|uniref:PCI domain-containing protein 2 n=1 Tax=Chionoecetes opilio TaxID=41210 RepID=A0A8J8WCF8_CHIOP|nr:PCI domain-containing protein 2 [Chionoecetes opilio]
MKFCTHDSSLDGLPPTLAPRLRLARPPPGTLHPEVLCRLGLMVHPPQGTVMPRRDLYTTEEEHATPHHLPGDGPVSTTKGRDLTTATPSAPIPTPRCPHPPMPELTRDVIIVENLTITSTTDLISFRDPHVMSSRLMVEKPERDVERVIDSSLAEVVAGHLRATWAAGSGATVEAWRTQMVVVQAVARFMQECKEENWMLPVMYTSCLDLR